MCCTTVDPPFSAFTAGLSGLYARAGDCVEGSKRQSVATGTRPLDFRQPTKTLKLEEFAEDFPGKPVDIADEDIKKEADN
jgi:hypothetical protein